MLYFDFYFLFSFVVNNTKKDVNHHNTKDQRERRIILVALRWNGINNNLNTV